MFFLCSSHRDCTPHRRGARGEFLKFGVQLKMGTGKGDATTTPVREGPLTVAHYIPFAFLACPSGEWIIRSCHLRYLSKELSCCRRLKVEWDAAVTVVAHTQ